jgi:hypothetical protein
MARIKSPCAVNLRDTGRNVRPHLSPPRVCCSALLSRVRVKLDAGNREFA